MSGGADADGPSLGRAGDARLQPMRTLWLRAPAERGARTQASGASALGTSREACQRTAMDGRPRLRSEPEGSAPPRLPGGRRRAGRRFRRPGYWRARVRGETGAGRNRRGRDRRARPGHLVRPGSGRSWPVHDRLRAGPAPPQEPEPVPRPGRPARGAGGSTRGAGGSTRGAGGSTRGAGESTRQQFRRRCRGPRGRCTRGIRPTPRRPSPRSGRRETRDRANRRPTRTRSPCAARMPRRYSAAEDAPPFSSALRTDA